MAAVTVIVMLSLVQYLYFAVEVGRARGRTGLEAPAVTGHPEFERVFRAHYNTLEQLVVFVPACFAAGFYAHELFAVACGVAYLLGRVLYFRSYIADPGKRGPGMLITMAANLLLVLGALGGALLTLF